MRIEVEPKLFEMFPGYVRYVLLVEGADNRESSPDLQDLLKEAQLVVRGDVAFEDLKAHPRIASWREAFQKFGVNPNQCPPSIANLIKRVRGGRDLPSINALVDLFNVVSLRSVVPAGGDDLDKVTGGVRLGIASGAELYTPLGQPDVVENPKAGEVILWDTGNQAVFCRAWCWKNGHTSRIEENTVRVAINIDALPPVTVDEGRAAAEATASLVRRFCAAEAVIYRLDAQSPFVDV